MKFYRGGKPLFQITKELILKGGNYADFKSLLVAILTSGVDISKDDVIEFLDSDSRIQLSVTPNSVSKLISNISKSYRPLNAIDICCGTGNILYYLQNDIDDLTGVEIDENVAELTKYFIKGIHVITADTFKYPFTRKYDLVVGNIPYGMRVEFDGKRIQSEEAFLRKAHELLTENGRAIMVVANSVLLSRTFQNFRKEFVSYLVEIIHLPSGSIVNTHLNTAILVIGKQKSKDVKITQLKDIDNLEKELQNASSITLSNEKLSERWDSEYSLTHQNSFYRELEGLQTKELQELADIINGKMISIEKLVEHGDFLYLKPMHIQQDGLKIDAALKYISKGDLSENDYRYILQPGDIVISTIFNDLKMYVYKTGDIPAFASNNLAIIRSSKQDYILSYLQTDEGRRIFKIQAEDLRKGTTIPHLNIKDIASIKIPILPVSDLNKFGDSSLSRATKDELLNQLELLNSFIITTPSDSIGNIVNESAAIYQSKQSEGFDIILSFIKDRFDKIESQLHSVNNKLDTLLVLINELKSDFESIQKLQREDEEKLFKFYQKIDAKLDTVFKNEQQTIEGYIEEIKRWLDLWEELDLQSKKFLPIAEFIFDELSKLQDADYAPFVVQYCRTFENEILKKLFEAYHNIGLADLNRDELVKDDLENQKTSKFAQMVKRNKVTYTLGDMNFIMALLKQGGTTLNESPLLQHFRAFTISYFDEKIVEAEFLKDVNKLTNDFRNKAAHPYSINIGLAKECQTLLRKSLNVFLDSIKK